MLREKIRPEKELQRATKQILKCKLGIRDAIRQLESLSSIGCIEDTAIASDGSVYHEHIICAKCKLREAFPDNDIILCDGTCNCAFHQKCLDPPLETENIPPGDQGWFCKFCECKMEILEAMNAHLGTRFSVDSTWQDIFKEEAALPDGGSALPYPEEDWPSDDSQDHDYDPERNENSCSISTAGTEGNASDDTNSSLSLSWSFEDEILSGSKRSGIISADSDETSDCEIISGRRQRRAVDYRKLYDEMFGKDAHANEQVSEDEDWGPANKRRREKESDAASTLITLYEGEKKLPNKLRQAFGENELPSRDVRENLAKQLGLDYEKAERAKQLQTSPRISKESRSEIVKDKTVDLVASRDNSSASLVRALKNLKKVRRRKNPKPIMTSPVKKKHHRRALLESPTNDKVTMEFDDDVSLKKQLKLLKEKSKRDKQRVDFKEGTGVQDAEKEMERLCQIKDKIEKLKQVILRLQCDKTNQWQDQSVIYVPVAELREKGRFCITS
ncbi:Pathogenesis-related homeodomain protein [Vitis vinifera]|uniref:Pathogenesis-related homeodomain protein n=1 Tax=Vitis vinifera TaxID=29760 RepID=A0A438BZ62_VITVI|nr:Pathogenesis-related homeodomain protein [Vitis vinifera]